MIKAFKGFDKDLKCRGMQYKENTEYEFPGKIKCCYNGGHACEFPFDVFSYYPPSSSRYCEVECDGVIDRDSDDSKIACSKLKIGAEIGLKGLIDTGIKFILEKIDWQNTKESNNQDQSAATNTGDYSAAINTGYQSAATNTGYRSAATNTGYRSAATNTGDRSAATNTGDYSVATNTGYQSAVSVEGKESVAFAVGFNSRAKGALGCWIVLAEWERYNNSEWHIKEVKTAKIDGKVLKPDTWYILQNGEFVEFKED